MLLPLGDTKLHGLAKLWSCNIKLQEKRLSRHFGNVIKIASTKILHQNDVKKFLFSSPFPLKQNPGCTPA